MCGHDNYGYWIEPVNQYGNSAYAYTYDEAIENASHLSWFWGQPYVVLHHDVVRAIVE